jgi:hypothetical protein
MVSVVPILKAVLFTLLELQGQDVIAAILIGNLRIIVPSLDCENPWTKLKVSTKETRRMV